MEYLGAMDLAERSVAARFGLLKQRLLLERLNATPESETHALIIRQADEAALMAWVSSYPLLLFPCLFEERAAGVTRQARSEMLAYWKGLEVETPVHGAQAGCAVRGNPSLRPLPRGPAGLAPAWSSCVSRGRAGLGIVNNI
jgi:hypothetical protein